MNVADAAAHLYAAGYRLEPGPSLVGGPGAEYAHCRWGGDAICLDGYFSATDLDAFSVWMRHQPFVALEMERIENGSAA